MEEKSDFIKCMECKWQDNCPVMWSYLNAACITIQEKKQDITKRTL
jgi:hypothetical protein